MGIPSFERYPKDVDELLLGLGLVPGDDPLLEGLEPLLDELLGRTPGVVAELLLELVLSELLLDELESLPDESLPDESLPVPEPISRM